MGAGEFLRRDGVAKERAGRLFDGLWTFGIFKQGCLVDKLSLTNYFDIILDFCVVH